MTERNKRRGLTRNNLRKNQLAARGLREIVQNQKLQLNVLTDEERLEFDETVHIYKAGDRLYKISYDYYGDTQFWWVIAWYNRLPTDFHIRIGDNLLIPRPLDKVLYMIQREA